MKTIIGSALNVLRKTTGLLPVQPKREAIPSMLALRNVTKAFDGQVVLNDLNLDIETGKITSVIGPSGEG